MAPPALSYLHSHLLVKLPYPTHTFEDQTIIVTGSNTGLGLESARHFTRLGASKVILAVRNLSRGQNAAKSIEESTGRSGVIEVWELNLSSYSSVKAFATRVEDELERLDVLVANAGVTGTDTFRLAEDNEENVTVNFVSTALLGLLVLPKLRETSLKHNKEVVVTFVGSFMHWLTAFPQRNSPSILADLANEQNAKMDERYSVSKLMLLLFARELATRVTHSQKAGKIVVSTVNPGSAAKSEREREHGAIAVRLTRKAVMRKTEEGSRTLVHAAAGGKETHEQYLNDCKVGKPSDFVLSSEGAEAQRKLWREVTEKLDKLQPGILQAI